MIARKQYFDIKNLFTPILTKHSLVTSKKMKALVAQSFPTLCNPMECSPPGSFVHRILQAIILEWVVIPFSRGPFQLQD